MLTVEKRVASTETLIDICSCEYFQSRLTGLVIIWLVAHLGSDFSEKTSFASMDENYSAVMIKTQKISETEFKEFLLNWYNKPIKSFRVEGFIRDIPCSVAIQFDSRQLAVELPKKNKDDFFAFENMITNACNAQFSLLKPNGDRREFGGKVYQNFFSRKFKRPSSVIETIRVFMNTDNSLFCWYNLMSEEDKKETGEEKYRHTSITKPTKKELMRDFSVIEKLARARCVIAVHKYYISCSIDVKTGILSLSWDKWLGTEVDIIIRAFNINVYEALLKQFLLLDVVNSKNYNKERSKK